MYSTKKKIVKLFGINFDGYTLSEAVFTSRNFIQKKKSNVCHYVVTPNVNHVVQLQSNQHFRDAYASASIVLADGMPLIWFSKFFRQPLPERVAGSDFVPALLKALANDRLTVFLLGARPGIAKLAAERIIKQYPKIKIVGYYSPPIGFENDTIENKKIIGLINAVKPQLLILGLGAPKQELWIYSKSKELEVNIAICAGATIDFLSGKKLRAPLWMRKHYIEWLHRIYCEPQRLSLRYLKDSFIFMIVVLKELYNILRSDPDSCEGKYQ